MGSEQNLKRCISIIQSPSSLTASAFLSLKSFSASDQTREVGNSSSEGRRSELNCSDASRGSKVGKWSMEMTDKGGFPDLVEKLSQVSISEARQRLTQHQQKP
jgi:hypothetical protein